MKKRNTWMMLALAWGLPATAQNLLSVKSYGFVDLEGAKPSALILEYDQEVKAASVTADAFQVDNYVQMLERQQGFDRTIEQDRDGIPGNEGQITRAYVSRTPAPKERPDSQGHFVILELNTHYMMSGQNLSYTTSMMAGVKQLRDLKTTRGTAKATGQWVVNYTREERQGWGGRTMTLINADKEKIILPEFDASRGWTLHHMGGEGFRARHCYSEYTGRYEDFELPYAIYVPDSETLERHKGQVSLVIHMEHAGGNDTDPMAAITSSRAAVMLAGENVQKEHPAIVVVPQVEESRRSTDDQVASSEVNTACWQLLDSLLAAYKGIIDEERIYGTGQSMGGMTVLNMSAQRDNFFAAVAVIGAQWSNNYNKDFQHNGSPARSPENDPISFNGWGLDRENYQNWYYMISDDNILVHTCKDDVMATGLWQMAAEYFAAAGVEIPRTWIDPYESLDTQNEQDRLLVNHPSDKPGTGISWGLFSRGSHMSTWKYAYQLDAPFEWLFQQRRSTAQQRGKVEQLRNPWLGRDENGKIRPGSGTGQLNSAQFTPRGDSKAYREGWTPESVGSITSPDMPGSARRESGS